MKQYLKGVAIQATSIILSAILAALIAYIQSILIQHGANVGPEINTPEAGLIGALIKGGHLTAKSLKTIV